MAGGFEIGLFALLVIASVTDLLWGKIPNVVNLSFLIFAFILQFYTGGWNSLLHSLLWVAASFALFFPLYVAKVFAAGDVKLLIVATAWSNLIVASKIAVGSIVIGALVGLFVLFRKYGIKSTGRHLLEVLRFQGKATERMPFAPALLCAFFALELLKRYQWNLI